MLAGLRHLPQHVGRAVAATALVAVLAAPTAYSLATAATPHTGSIPSAGPSSDAGPGGARPGGQGGGQGGVGGLLDGSESTAALTALLQEDAASYTWAAAAVGSNSASGYQLASGEPVMAIGGFNGSDPSPTLAQFRAYVADGAVHWFIARGGGLGGPQGGGGSGTAAEITEWVTATFPASTVDGVTVYDLSGGAQ